MHIPLPLVAAVAMAIPGSFVFPDVFLWLRNGRRDRTYFRVREGCEALVRLLVTVAIVTWLLSRYA